ncbi:MAG: hypothetical protein AB7F79_01665 [Steroidobacteraceae bacterium]
MGSQYKVSICGDCAAIQHTIQRSTAHNDKSDIADVYTAHFVIQVDIDLADVREVELRLWFDFTIGNGTIYARQWAHDVRCARNDTSHRRVGKTSKRDANVE